MDILKKLLQNRFGQQVVLTADKVLQSKPFHLWRMGLGTSAVASAAATGSPLMGILGGLGIFYGLKGLAKKYNPVIPMDKYNALKRKLKIGVPTGGIAGLVGGYYLGNKKDSNKQFKQNIANKQKGYY